MKYWVLRPVLLFALPILQNIYFQIPYNFSKIEVLKEGMMIRSNYEISDIVAYLIDPKNKEELEQILLNRSCLLYVDEIAQKAIKDVLLETI